MIYVQQRRFGTFSISHDQSKLVWTLPWREKVKRDFISSTRRRQWRRAEIAATYHSIIRTVKMQGRSAWEYLSKFFTKNLIKRIESNLFGFLSVKTLSNVFNGCRDFFSLRPDKFSCQRVQSQTYLSYAECSRKSWNKSDWQYANIFDKWEQWKLAFKLSSEENV